MKQKLLLLTVALSCAMGTWAYTGVEPAAGRTYFLYNVGANAYFVGTSGSYGTDGNIANATPVMVETSGSNFKLAFVYGGTTYRIYHKEGSRECYNTTGVEFWKTGDANGYKLVSKNTKNNRYMDNGGWFGTNSGDNNTSWQFIACEDAMTHMSTFCAEVAGANYVQSAKGWERVTSISQLQTNPEDYFFAIFSANAVGLIVDASSDNAEPSRPYYKTAADPLSSSQYLFEIENYEPDGFALKSCGLNNYFGNNSDSWNFQNPSEKEANCKLTITLNDGAYRIQSANADWEGRRYWGLYDYTGYTNGQKFAGNKNDAEKGSFLIYRIPKKNLDMTSRMSNAKGDWSSATNDYSGGVERYNGDTDAFATGNVLTQTISDLPNGIYEVEFYAWENFSNWDNNAGIAYDENEGDKNIAQVFANVSNEDIHVIKNTGGREFDASNSYTLYAQVTDGSLIYGVKNKAAGGNWAVCKATSLTYLVSSLSEAKEPLLAKITAANGIYNNGANVGSGVFQIPTAAGNTFSSAIATAQGVYDNASATYEQVISATSTLQTAIETYESATLNAPAAGTRYYIKVATSGHAKNGNAVILVPGSTSDNNPTGYGLNANFAPSEYLTQAFVFTQVSENTYNISIDCADGTVYLTYGSLNGSAASWKTSQIQATTDASKKGEFEIVATTTANVFKIKNTGDDAFIDCQDGGNIYTDANITNEDFTIAEAPQASVELSIAAGKYATRIFPFVPALPSGVKAYSCNGAGGNVLTLVEVLTPAANVPYILENTGSDINTILSGYGTASADSYTEGKLTGVYTAAEVPVNSYVLQTQEGVQAFYKVTESGKKSSAYRAYLTLPSEVKAFFFSFAGETGITETAEKTEGTDSLFDLSGRRVSKAQKGLYIMNGKKVMVK